MEENVNEQRLCQAVTKLVYSVNKQGSWKKKRELKYNNIDKKVMKIMLGDDKCIPKVQEQHKMGNWATRMLKQTILLEYENI